MDNNMEDGQTEDEQMEEEEEEEEEEESRQEEAGDKEKVVEEMIGDYESQQKVFRKMRSTSNPSRIGLLNLPVEPRLGPDALFIQFYFSFT